VESDREKERQELEQEDDHREQAVDGHHMELQEEDMMLRGSHEQLVEE
jgi:hypothetical protein